MFPKLILNKNKANKNIVAIKNVCDKKNISIAGVIKGCNGDLQFTELLIENNIKYIASSRIEQLEKVNFFHNNVKTMLLRIPMIS